MYGNGIINFKNENAGQSWADFDRLVHIGCAFSTHFYVFKLVR